jgi:hypothetical protein
MRITIASLALLLATSASHPEQIDPLTLACNGTSETDGNAKLESVANMGVIVNLTRSEVAGFAGLTARIDDVNDSSVSFKGTDGNWYLSGHIDRITGELEAYVQFRNRENRVALPGTAYHLLCKPTKRIF